MLGAQIFSLYFTKWHISRAAKQVLLSTLSLLFCLTNAHAQLTVDDGLPPGWENWEKACGQTGGLSACQNLGKIWVFGVERPINLTKASAYFYKGCEIYNDLDSCAMTIEYARDLEPNSVLYEKALNVGCLMKEFRYCIELYDEVRPSPILYKLSLGAACNAGDPDVCAVAAIKYNPGKTPRPGDPASDLKFSLKWAKRGCELKNAFSCKTVGKAYAGFLSKPPLLAKNTEVGLNWFRKACQLGDGGACMEIMDYATGNAKNLDVSDVINIAPNDIEMALKRGCDDYYPQMCIRAAIIYDAGKLNMTPDPKRAIKFAMAACYTDDKYYKGFKTPEYFKEHIRTNCNFAAHLTANAYEKTGKLTFDDILTAKRGCEFGSAEACYRQGRAEIVHERFSAGTASMGKSCDLGDKLACEWVSDNNKRIREEKEARLKRAAERRRARQAELEAQNKQRKSSTTTLSTYVSSYTPPSRSYLAPNTNRSFAPQESSAAIYNRVRVRTKLTYCNTGGTYGC